MIKLTMLFLLSSCQTLVDYAEIKKQELKNYEKATRYSIDLNTILDDFYLFNPDPAAVKCATEYEHIIEREKKVQLPDEALENLLILCQRMIWLTQKTKIINSTKKKK